ncbi:hypothetical protein D3C73_1492900 [compost metagenome]
MSYLVFAGVWMSASTSFEQYERGAIGMFVISFQINLMDSMYSFYGLPNLCNRGKENIMLAS